MTTTTNNHFQPTYLQAYKYNSYLADCIAKIWETKPEDDFITLKDFPKDIEKYKMKYRRENLDKILEERLTTLEEENHRLLETKKSNSSIINTRQTKYAFVPEYKDIMFCGIEVNCRLITSNKTTANTTYNLVRVGGITFKGKNKLRFDHLINRCKNELETNFNENITEINSTAMYIGNHLVYKCPWKCQDILNNLKDNPNSESSRYFIDSKDCICFYKRQIIGQGFYPYVDPKNDDDKNEYNIHINNNDYVFDNIFFKNNMILGVNKLNISYEPNFLNIVGNDVCTALISFSLDYVGVTGQGLSLYLKPLDQGIIYATNLDSSENFPSAKRYLEDQLHFNNKIINILKTKHQIIVPQDDEPVPHRNDDEEPTSKKIKLEQKQQNDDYHNQIDEALKALNP